MMEVTVLVTELKKILMGTYWLLCSCWLTAVHAAYGVRTHAATLSLIWHICMMAVA